MGAARRLALQEIAHQEQRGSGLAGWWPVSLPFHAGLGLRWFKVFRCLVLAPSLDRFQQEKRETREKQPKWW